MGLKILTKKENPLLKREEIDVELDVSGATPSRKDVLAEASKNFGLPEDQIIVDKITTIGGRKQGSARLLLYKKKEDIPKYKILKMEKRISGVKKGEAAPAKQQKPA